MFNVGDRVKHVLSLGLLTVEKVIRCSSTRAYMVAPLNGEPFRASEGELMELNASVSIDNGNDSDNE